MYHCYKAYSLTDQKWFILELYFKEGFAVHEYINNIWLEKFISANTIRKKLRI